MALQKELLLKLTSMRWLKEGVTAEKLHEFANKEHAPGAAAIQARHGFIKVVHYHTPAATRDLIKAVPLPPGWTINDHDIGIGFYVRSMDQLQALMADPEFQAMLAEEVDIIDPSRANLTLGWEEVYVEDGKVVNIEGGAGTYPDYTTIVSQLVGDKKE